MEFQFSHQYCKEEDGQEWATVPEEELQKVLHAANIAATASPATCLHPADSLQSFELITDACVCGECGCILKNYTTRRAAALGITPGWHRLGVELLEAEIYQALKPALDVLTYISTECGKYGDAADTINWADSIESSNPMAKALSRVR